MKTSKVGLTLLLVCCVWAVFIVAGCTKAVSYTHLTLPTSDLV